MAITVQCKSCGMQFRAKEEWIGKRAKCTYCGHIIIIRKVYVAPGQKLSRSASEKAPTAEKSKAAEPQGPVDAKAGAKKEQGPEPEVYELSEPDNSRPRPAVEGQNATASVTPVAKNCDICRQPTLTLSEIDEEDGRRRRSASLGKEEYPHSFYKALCAKQGYRCAGCGRIFCEKCLTAGSQRKTNVENIVCVQCAGGLVICR